MSNEGKQLRCTNQKDCPAQIAGRFEQFVSKHALDIEGLGPSIIEQIIVAGFVRRPIDLYQLSVEQLQGLPGFGVKRAENIVAAIQKSRQQDGWRLLVGMGIDGVGVVTAQQIYYSFSLDGLLEADLETLRSMESIGPVTAQAIVDYFAQADAVADAKAFQVLGLYTQQGVEQPSAGRLSEQVWVITGRFDFAGRGQIKALLEAQGASSGYISQKVTI